MDQQLLNDEALQDGYSAAEVFESSKTHSGLSYDDIILLPGHIDFGVEDVRLKSKVTRTLELQTPFVSSPMDTVTEASMAIGMALHGGLGVIHYNMSIEDQCTEVHKVKKFKNGFITEPTVLAPENTLADVDIVKQQYGHSGIPITLDGGLHSKLVGIVTK